MKAGSKRGDAVAAFQGAAVKHDAVYTTAPATHNPIELHASVATYEDGSFTLYETSQAIFNHRDVMSAALGVSSDRVEIVTEFLGSGFGGKLWPWTHSLLAAACARSLNRPVKLVVSRSMMFQSVGHRPATAQQVLLAAEPSGKLLSIGHHYVKSHRNPRRLRRGLRRSHGTALFVSERQCHKRPGATQRWLGHRHARPRCSPRPLCDRECHG